MCADTVGLCAFQNENSFYVIGAHTDKAFNFMMVGIFIDENRAFVWNGRIAGWQKNMLRRLEKHFFDTFKMIFPVCRRDKAVRFLIDIQPDFGGFFNVVCFYVSNHMETFLFSIVLQSKYRRTISQIEIIYNRKKDFYGTFRCFS